MTERAKQVEQVTFGEQLRTMRQSRKISQTSLSNATGISQTRISELELGKTLPGLRDFSLLRRVLPIDSCLIESAIASFEDLSRWKGRWPR